LSWTASKKNGSEKYTQQKPSFEFLHLWGIENNDFVDFNTSVSWMFGYKSLKPMQCLLLLLM
jgi:hypothetical protein